jgi:hypothetical protein
VDIKTIASWLGHSSTKLTLDTYGLLMGTDADRAAIERVNRAFTSHDRPGSRPGEQSLAFSNPLTCIDTRCPRQDSNLRHPL